MFHGLTVAHIPLISQLIPVVDFYTKLIEGCTAYRGIEHKTKIICKFVNRYVDADTLLETFRTEGQDLDDAENRVKIEQVKRELDKFLRDGLELKFAAAVSHEIIKKYFDPGEFETAVEAPSLNILQVRIKPFQSLKQIDIQFSTIVDGVSFDE